MFLQFPMGRKGLSGDLALSEMLPSNPCLQEKQNELLSTVLSLMESSEPEAEIYVCPPLDLTVLKTSTKLNHGFISIVDTHAVPIDLGGNSNRVVMLIDFDEHSKTSKCALLCDLLGKRSSMYPFPNQTRQSLIHVRKENVFDIFFTKFAPAFPVRNTSAETLARKVMDEYICRIGCFENLHSDQGANVDGAVFQGLCNLIEAAKTRRTPYHPQGDGQVERLKKIACEDLVQVDI